MSPVSTVALIGLLAAILVAVAALLVWQEAKRGPGQDAATYVIEDAVDFILPRLDSGAGLARADVKRIIEWEVYYLQGLAQPQRWRQVETVAGGHEPAVDFIRAQIAEKHGAAYSPDQIREVLVHEDGYLVSIGVVGEPVEGGAGDMSEVDEP